MRCWLLLGGRLVHDEFGIKLKTPLELNNTSSTSFMVLYHSDPELLRGCNEFFGLRRMLIYIQR